MRLPVNCIKKRMILKDKCEYLSCLGMFFPKNAGRRKERKIIVKKRLYFPKNGLTTAVDNVIMVQLPVVCG